MSKNRFSLNGAGKDPALFPDERKRRVINDLSARFQELNNLWERAEEELREIPLPVEVHVCYESVDAHPEQPRGEEIHRYLGFMKSKGGWRICFGETHDGFPEIDHSWKPIGECPLDLRVEASAHIDKLFEAVLKTAEECVSKLDHAIATFRGKLANG